MISGSFYLMASVAPLKSMFMSGLGISSLENVSLKSNLDYYLFSAGVWIISYFCYDLG